MTAYEVATLTCRLVQIDATRGEELGIGHYVAAACDLLDIAQREIELRHRKANPPDPRESIELRRECGISD